MGTLAFNCPAVPFAYHQCVFLFLFCPLSRKEKIFPSANFASQAKRAVNNTLSFFNKQGRKKTVHMVLVWKGSQEAVFVNQVMAPFGRMVFYVF